MTWKWTQDRCNEKLSSGFIQHNCVIAFSEGCGCVPGRSVFHYEFHFSELEGRSLKKMSVHITQNFACFHHIILAALQYKLWLVLIIYYRERTCTHEGGQNQNSLAICQRIKKNKIINPQQPTNGILYACLNANWKHHSVIKIKIEIQLSPCPKWCNKLAR